MLREDFGDRRGARCDRPEQRRGRRARGASSSAADDAVRDALGARLAEHNRQPLRGTRLEPDTLAGAVRRPGRGRPLQPSWPMRAAHAVGVVLALGSDDAQRFRPDMSTVYLARIGELAAGARPLAVWCRPATSNRARSPAA
ncbi:MAG: hypothetical protein MZV65_52625 [Chromatiales bacterium]|nr:hypothetical protein [Chromatiales bacterium]